MRSGAARSPLPCALRHPPAKPAAGRLWGGQPPRTHSASLPRPGTHVGVGLQGQPAMRLHGSGGGSRRGAGRTLPAGSDSASRCRRASALTRGRVTAPRLAGGAGGGGKSRPAPARTAAPLRTGSRGGAPGSGCRLFPECCGAEAREIPLSPPAWLPRQWTLPAGQRVVPLPRRRRGLPQPPGGAAAQCRGTAGLQPSAAEPRAEPAKRPDTGPSGGLQQLSGTAAGRHGQRPAK